MKDQEFENKKNIIIRYWWVWVLIIIWIVGHGRWGTIIWDRASTICGIIFFIFLFVGTVWSAMKNASPKIIGIDDRSTTDGTVYQVGDYYIFKRGGIKVAEAFGMVVEGNEGIQVVPQKAVNVIGDNFVHKVNMKKVSVNKLPPDVASWVIVNGIPGPYFYGEMNEEMDYELKYESPGLIMDRIQKLNQRTNMLNDIIELNFGSVEDAVAFSERIAKRKEKSGLEKALDKLMKEED